MRRATVALLVGVALIGCKREERQFSSAPPAESEAGLILMSTNGAGPGDPLGRPSPAGPQYSGNAYHISEGQRLFTWFNCSGCHGKAGGGGMGPALMDADWLYGSAIDNVAATIREGRPNGMPSFRGRVPEQQIWELAVFVRSLSGLEPQSATPVRTDDIHAVPQHLKPEGDEEQGATAERPTDQ